MEKPKWTTSHTTDWCRLERVSPYNTCICDGFYTRADLLSVIGTLAVEIAKGGFDAIDFHDLLGEYTCTLLCWNTLMRASQLKNEMQKPLFLTF